MVRLMHKKYSPFLMMKHSVLLFINLASFLFFTKIVSTLYTGLYISFLFSHINISHPKKMVPLPYVKNQHRRGKQLEKVAGAKTWFFT